MSALLFLAVAAMAASAPIEEGRCDYLVSAESETERQPLPGQGILALSVSDEAFTADIPSGASVICSRSSIVPASGDWKVLAAGHVLFLVETNEANRVGALEISGGQFRFRLVGEDHLTEEEGELVVQRLNEFQLANRSAPPTAEE